MARDQPGPRKHRRMDSWHDESEDLRRISRALDEEMTDEGITTGQFHAITQEQLSRPVQKEPSVPPRADFLANEAVKQLSSVQREATDKVHNILLLLASTDPEE